MSLIALVSPLSTLQEPQQHDQQQEGGDEYELSAMDDWLGLGDEGEGDEEGQNWQQEEEGYNSDGESSFFFGQLPNTEYVQ